MKVHVLAIAQTALIAAAAAHSDEVHWDRLVAKIDMDDLRRGAQQLQDFAYSYKFPYRNRQFGSPAHNDSINWIAKTLEDTGYYKVWFEKFSHPVWYGSGNVSIDGTPVADSFLLTYSNGGAVSAPLVPVANIGCEASDYPAALSGKVALISRGTCSFAIKSDFAKAAGAVGVVIYNNGGTYPNWGLGAPASVPVAGIQTEAGRAALAAIQGGATVVASFNANIVFNELRDTYNLFAETKGGNKENVLMVGAHSDSVFEGPGINDDGSGMIGILTTALGLTNFTVNNAVRFAWWSAEEVGLVGSRAYVASLTEKQIKGIRAYLNFDMIASPNFVYGIYDGDGSSFGLEGPPGSDVIEAFFESWFVRNKKPFVATEFSGRSDYGPFLDVGIPAGGLFTGADDVKTEEWQKLFGGVAGEILDQNYHKVGDDIFNLAMDAFYVNAQGIAYAVGEFARRMHDIEQAQHHAKNGKAKKARKEPDFKGIHQHACSGHSTELA